MSLFQFLGGRKKLPVETQQKSTIEVLFHKECNGHVEHGTMYANHAGLNLKKEPIRFMFAGLSEPPDMTPELLMRVWDAAEGKGYIPLSLRSYATVFALMPTPEAPTNMARTPGNGQVSTHRRHQDHRSQHGHAHIKSVK